MAASLDESGPPTAFDASPLILESSEGESVLPHRESQEAPFRCPRSSCDEVPRAGTVSTLSESTGPPHNRRSAERLKHPDTAKPTATTWKPSTANRRKSRSEAKQRSRPDSRDMVTFELQYPPRKFSPIEASSVSSPHDLARRSATRGSIGRTILEDKAVKLASDSISGKSLGGPVRKRPLDVDEGEGSSSCQQSEINTSSMQRPLIREPRPSGIVPVSSDLQMAPLIESTSWKSTRPTHQEKSRHAVTKARIQSAASSPLDCGEEKESSKSNELQRKGRETTGLSAPDGSINRHSPAIPGSPEAEHIVVQANEGPVLESWRRVLLARERLLYLLAFLLSSVLVLVLTILISPLSASSTGGAEQGRVFSLPTCASASCLQNAMYLNHLLSWDEVDPCDDFYAFVCRHWTSPLYPPSGSYPVSADDDYVSYLERRLYALLQDESQTTTALQPLQDLYEKCADVRRTEDEGWNLLLELMFNVSLGGFPFTPPVRESVSVWKAAAKILRKTGSSALLSVRIGSHPTEIRDVASVGAPQTMTSGGGVDIDEAARLYTAAAFSAMRTLGKGFIPSSLALAVVKLATEIEELSVVSMDNSSPVLYDVNTTPELLDFIGGVFRRINGTPFTGGLDSDVLVFTPGLVSRILAIVRKAEAHTVMNYLGVRLMIEISPFIPHANLTDAYITLLYGKRRGLLPRWKLCIRVVDRALFPLVVFSLFADLKLHVSMRRFVYLVYEVIAEFSRGIDNSAHFEARSKTAIRNLLSTTETRVLGPDWINSPALVDSFASNVPTITGARRGLESYVATYEYTFIEVLKLGSRQRWSRSAFTADCWYEPNPRTIYVPLLAFNITQAFDNNIDALQLSRVGPRLGRCIFDALLSEGNSSNATTAWLTGETRSKLQEAEGCFGAHGAHLGSFSRVRDSLSGLFAYAQFERSMRTSDKVLALRLLGDRVFSESQLFFVYLMLQTCEKGDHVSMNSPALAGRRWFVALRNGRDFSSAYNCSAGSGMNPRRKCAAA
ncbi:hypothetical protein HPB48_002480 [Haemaphysalis longicornis]|uniref:Peptidase M13 N-terminal domain-containing protein n=1 Tax=Haemaphysalis longicornis TaxID=44386 RepID=A0A9J6G5R8_HAELO|nr:hypothetical protein HPB48_002480 [Haemaphysalis longicornis]